MAVWNAETVSTQTETTITDSQRKGFSISTEGGIVIPPLSALTRHTFEASWEFSKAVAKAIGHSQMTQLVANLALTINLIPGQEFNRKPYVDYFSKHI